MQDETIQPQNLNKDGDKYQPWLDEEIAEIGEVTNFGERLPPLKLEENKLTEFDVDFSKAFDKWIDPASKQVKKIIPVTHAGEKKVLWLNTANPAYKQIIEAGKKGQTHFKIMRTGQKRGTRYTLVD